jgi:hypothetical protein
MRGIRARFRARELRASHAKLRGPHLHNFLPKKFKGRKLSQIRVVFLTFSQSLKIVTADDTPDDVIMNRGVTFLALTRNILVVVKYLLYSDVITASICD